MKSACLSVEMQNTNGAPLVGTPFEDMREKKELRRVGRLLLFFIGVDVKRAS